jgi:hypothetical protein
VEGTFPIKVLPVKLHSKSDPIAVLRLRKRMLSPAAQLFLIQLKAVAASM